MSSNPYAPPKAAVVDVDQFDPDDVEYAGFWIRLGAYLLDSIILAFITVPLLLAVYGTAYFNRHDGRMFAGFGELIISYVFPAAWAIIFWVKKQATPGKMIVSVKVVDADTGAAPTAGQATGRYFAYILSFLVFGLGFLWIAWDRRKQGWHDKLARTIVVRAY